LLIVSVALPLFLFAQGGQEAQPTAAPASKPAVATPVAKEPTQEELIAAAQKEGTLTVYTPSTRHAQVAADFEKKYGIKTTVSTVKDVEMIEKVSKEAAANLDAADCVFCQDGGRVYTELMEPGYVTSYTPVELRSIIPAQYQSPEVWDLCTKTFNYNSGNGGQPITNIWQLTEPDWKGRIQFKDPFQEGVNMNFLTMITRDDYAKKLSDAYKDLYGKDLKLTTKNAGYEWIKMFYANTVLGKSDTTIAEQVGAKGQAKQMMGLFTANKLRTAKAKNLDLTSCYDVKPFGGFYYPIYAFIPSNTRSPNAAKLFIQYALSPEGYSYFNTLGDYSPNPQLANTEDKVSILDWGKQLVYEDPQWCAKARADVEDFVNSIM